MRFRHLVLPVLSLTSVLAWIIAGRVQDTRAQNGLTGSIECCGGTPMGLRELDFPY
jgi:hypothetical protein